MPVKYGLRLPMDATYELLKERLAKLCSVSSDNLLLAEVSGAMIKVIVVSVITRVFKTKSIAGFPDRGQQGAPDERIGTVCVSSFERGGSGALVAG